jgi:hypothetical protein
VNDYYIAYNIWDRDDQMIGTGTCYAPMNHAPRNPEEVASLGFELTRQQSAAGTISVGQKVHVLSWSKLGG